MTTRLDFEFTAIDSLHITALIVLFTEVALTRRLAVTKVARFVANPESGAPPPAL